MSAIAEFVQQEPLFETHTQQNRFHHHPWDRKNHTDFFGYAAEDFNVAGWPRFPGVGQAPTEQVFDLWPFVATTGYGRAARLGCRHWCGLELNRANAPEIDRILQDYIRSRTPAEIFAETYRRMNITWSVDDSCWHFLTPLVVFEGKEHLPFFKHALRHDELLCPPGPESVRRLEAELNCSIHSLREFDEVLDRYTETAWRTGGLVALKVGIAYHRHLDFEDVPLDQAAPVFDEMMRGCREGLKPLHDYLLHRFIDRAETLSVPVQIHTGYLAGNWGDPSRGDPTGLAAVFAKHRNVAFDLFHAAWPYCDVASALGKAFPNVWLDLCWMWAINPARAGRVLEEWLHAVPSNKILGFGADTGSPFTMLGYTIQARQGIASTLQRMVQENSLNEEEARFIARRIMSENARDLFRM